ncbi:toxin glutamine deamidase domain-containing protein [Streptomyces sp. NPDC049915]|uniref:toxin glutamine deamidase domain-containing protein n=1 Tax=Streptomyces sp. NPDC049915 TaxID=3155510 RepID=UPI00343961DE
MVPPFCVAQVVYLSRSALQDHAPRAGSGAFGPPAGVADAGLAGGGHVFNVVNNRGRVTFLDGQSGEASDAPDWDSYRFMRTN